uniref:target of Nesh-SH3 isoform X1 n=1 Tax=Semicossyphus pulcher TaxID=241346 RepID=UPI0037E8AE0B
MNDCLEDGHYTVRYRERNRKWNYQTCPTSDTVVDHLKPNTVYEFGVQPNSKDTTGPWSKPVIHNISSGGIEVEKTIRKIFKRPVTPVKPLTPGPHSFPFPPRHVPHNRTQGRVPLSRNLSPKTTLAPTTTTRQESLSTPGPTLPVVTKQPVAGGDRSRSDLPPSLEIPLTPRLHPPLHITPTMASVPVPQKNVEKHEYPLSQPQLTTQSQPHQEIQPKPQSQSKYRPPPQINPKTPNPQLKYWAKAQPKPQTTSQPIPQTQPQTTSQPIPQIQPQETSQPIPQTQPQTASQPNRQNQPQTASQPIPQTQPQTTSQPIPHTQPQMASQPIPQTELQTASQPIPQNQPQTESQSIPQTQPQTASQPNRQNQPQTASQPNRQNQPQTASQSIPQTQPQTASQSIPQTQSQETSQPIRQNQPQTASQSIPQTQPQTASQPIPQIQPPTASQPIPQNQPPTASQSIPQTQPQTTSQPIPQTQPKKASQPIPQTQPQMARQPIPHTQPQIKPQPTSQPTPENQHQPQPKPTPQHKPLTQQQPKPQPSSEPIPQTKPLPKPKSQPIRQTQLQHQPKPSSQPLRQTQPQPQPQPASKNVPRFKPKPDPSSQPMLKTLSQSQSQIKPHPQSKPQTTTQLPTEPKLQPTVQLKHQVHPQTQPHVKTQTQPRVQTTIQPTPMAHPQMFQPTLQHIPQTQQPPPKIHIKPQHQPELQSTIEPHPQTQPQPKINAQPRLKTKPETNKKQSKIQPTPKPKSNVLQPKPKKHTNSQCKAKKHPQTKSQSKPQPPPHPKKQLKLQPQSQPKPQPMVQEPHTKIQQWPQSQPPIKTKTQPIPHSKPILQPQPPTTQSKSPPDPQSKPQPAPRPQQQPQLDLQSESQSRSYSDPTKVTPRQAVTTAPSQPEEGKPLPRPDLATEKAGSYDQGTGVFKSSTAEVPQTPISSSVSQAGRNSTLSRTRVPPNSNRKSVRPFSPTKTFTSSHSSSTPGAVGGAHHRGNALPKPVVWPRDKTVLHPPIPVNKRTNLVGKPNDHDKPMDLKQGEKESILKTFPLVTAKPKQERRKQTTTSAPAVNSSRFDINENSSIFRPLPASEVDIMGKKRFVAPHVVYKTDKKPDEPCSITSSLAYFPDEEGSDQNVTGPPRIPPSNLTVVTVEGCPSFVILDWQKSDNETREYEVVSTSKGPNGHKMSILTTTNQTHTAVENLKPESSYEFKVTPKNELGTGPSSDPVSFSTESADPRVSENVSGKDAIWTQFPFKSDAYSECNGKQYVKRTWYRKFVGIQLCNSLRYKIYLSDSLNGKFYNIGDQTGYGEDHCQFVDSFLDGRTGTQMFADQLQSRTGYYRALRQEPVHFGEIGGKSHVTYVGWYECGTPIPGKW